MSHTLYVVDAFTEKPFGGNPAAICTTDSPRDAGWMQRVAQEMNLSETAFLYPIDGGYHLRWFTLWQTGALPLKAEARFQTLSG